MSYTMAIYFLGFINKDGNGKRKKLRAEKYWLNSSPSHLSCLVLLLNYYSEE